MMALQDLVAMGFGMKSVISPTYFVNQTRSNASDICLQSGTKAAIRAVNISCSYIRNRLKILTAVGNLMPMSLYRIMIIPV